MGFDNRLTADEIAALSPGDAVTIECGQEFARPRYRPGKVIRVGALFVDVATEGARGGKYVEQYRRRDGVRDGGGGRAELVRAGTAVRPDRGRGTQHIDGLYRQWRRRPGDVDALRELRDAITEHLDEALVP
ncbi:hypothetical protein E4P40_20455 [Blastococcus sp. CT_GayMR20]|uniref:hypothetical protein n=1 Tax=Blastococcus sp. CT_GayMR20 TaxID=2559609 RepID=UPI0010747A7E|nr:hypothetical protein [Blastococcus sp. CT_GayMR20]TFV72484.1 hypothetical protein E4P40_20455 [Blastococcus sp. CT_GayMR20]